MEIAWKLVNLFLGLVLIGLCSGFPIALENSAADYHTQFLTGLVGVLLTICGIVFLIGCLCFQRKNGFKEFHNSPVVASSSSSLDHGHINPIANGEFTIFTPLSPIHHNNNIFLANEQVVGHSEIDYNHSNIDVHSWFDGTENDFPRTKLKYIKELGKGWFGRVVEGTAQDLNGNAWEPVAVRILETCATSSQRAVFLHDAAIYRCGKHPHILKLLGRSLDSVPLLLLQELCPYGDLKKYLKSNQGSLSKLTSSELPLVWCCQLTSALKHLHDHRLTHPDLATRNCQLISDLSLKLGDYGLAASLYPEDYYKGAPAVPVRWCAPESLTFTSTTIQPKQITFEGNVWSLGVTMWEIYECGAQPYTHLNDDDVISQVLSSPNVRLLKPSLSILYTDYIFRLMQLCWSSSESRPSVSQIHLMLSDLMQVNQNTKHVAKSESLMLMEDFDKRWDSFKPNSVARTDNQDFIHETASLADVNLSNITLLNLNLDKEEKLLNTKPMSPSLNNLHGSLDNLTTGEMDSWLQKVANKTGDMSYVHGLSEAIKDLDNALALENVSSSDSSHQPSPAPENANIAKVKNKLEFKLGPTVKTLNDSNKTQNNSLSERMQRTSSDSETEDENWRRKVEQGVYSEKVQQKSKSVTDLMILTHIDCSESDSETPLPSLDYRVNYKNIRYAPKQNLENLSLTFGSEGNLLSVHDKFQEELKKLREERKDSLLFVPDYINRNNDKPIRYEDEKRNIENFSSDEETWCLKKDPDSTCKYVNTHRTSSIDVQKNVNLADPNVSHSHRNPETLIEELSSPTDIQPANQVYNIFNVSVDSNFSPLHITQNLQKDIISLEDLELKTKATQNCDKTLKCSFDVPKLKELIQNNDALMDYIINKYESQDDLNISKSVNKELNNNVACIQKTTQKFLQTEKENYDDANVVKFDISLTQEEIVPNSMIHSVLCSSTPLIKRFNIVPPDGEEDMLFSSNFVDSDAETKSSLKYSLETWDNFLGKALEGHREPDLFEEFSSEPQSLLFLSTDTTSDITVECKNEQFDCENQDEIENDNADISVDSDTLVKQIDKTYTVDIIEDMESNENNQMDNSQLLNKTYEKQVNNTIDKEDTDGNWEPGVGWFLHPQINSDLSGQIESSQVGDGESYVGFSMDDEIMVAIRNELLMKLPHAQGQSNEQVKDSDDWDSEERNEVVIKYNVYTTPLSPIPEESYSEHDYSHNLIYNREDNSDSEDDWPEPYEDPSSELLDTETPSIQNIESPLQGPPHRHTPSQDSCCSNDTLFNLEELTCGVNESDNSIDKKNCESVENNKKKMLNAEQKVDVTLKLENDQDNIEKILNVVEKENDDMLINNTGFIIELGTSNPLTSLDIVTYNNEFKISTDACDLQHKSQNKKLYIENHPQELIEGVLENENYVEINESGNLDVQISNISKEEHKLFTDECECVQNSMNFESQSCTNKDKIVNDDNSIVNNLKIDTVNIVISQNEHLKDINGKIAESHSINLEFDEDQEIFTLKNIETSENNGKDYKNAMVKNIEQTTDSEKTLDLVDEYMNEVRNLNKFGQIQTNSSKHDKSKNKFDQDVCKVNNTKESMEMNENENEDPKSIMQNDIKESQNEIKSNETFKINTTENDGIENNQISVEVMQDQDISFVISVKQLEKIKQESSEAMLENINLIISSNVDLSESTNKTTQSVTGNPEEHQCEVDSQPKTTCNSNDTLNQVKYNSNVNVEGVVHINEVEEPIRNSAEKHEVISQQVDNIASLENLRNMKNLDLFDNSTSEIRLICDIENSRNEERDAIFMDNSVLNTFDEKNYNGHLKEKDDHNISSAENCDKLNKENQYIDEVQDVNKLNSELITINNNSSEYSTYNKSISENNLISELAVTEELENDAIGVLKNVDTFMDIKNTDTENNSETNIIKGDQGNDCNVIIDCHSEGSLKCNKNNQSGNHDHNSTNLSKSSIKNMECSLENHLEITLQSNKESLNSNLDRLLENNPNYITEFINNERQNSISNLASSEKDEDFDRVTRLKRNADIMFIPENNDMGYVNVKPNSFQEIVAYVNTTELQPMYVNLIDPEEEHLYDPVDNEQDIDVYDALTDIRFTGPTDIQLMSTSFSESADIDEQDWDSGSDTRSSSSGEFIWKEGEHEESVKALRAAPQDASTNEKMTPIEDIDEGASESSDEDDEGDSPEFVPSAWDKYATPTKSALRSPEKTLEKSEIKHKKPKGVWFKKQKYHCVYEYPREPESPSLNSFELWQPITNSLIGNWEVDTSPYIPDPHVDNFQHLDKHARNLYHFADFTSGMTTLEDEFFISSTTRPFEAFGGLSSQFFPGKRVSDHQWVDLAKGNDNITPDSGVEDVTPASNFDSTEFPHTSVKPQIHPLKLLAAAALKQSQISKVRSSNKDCLGGLRHARNKLKLDLPPSPNAFSSTKVFTIEPEEEPIMKHEIPTFTTFGKSRFLVQQVDTPMCNEESEKKNVSFEALPYKPLQLTTKGDKAKVEIRGEASLLDSADEDSGIESSTLERKKITNVAD